MDRRARGRRKAQLSVRCSRIVPRPARPWMADAGFEMVRYADDFVILCRSARRPTQALELVQRWTGQRGSRCIRRKRISWTCSSRAALTSSAITSGDGIAWPRTKSLQKLKAIASEDRRNNGQSLRSSLRTSIARCVGWFAYFRHSNGVLRGPRCLDSDAPAEHPPEARWITGAAAALRGPRCWPVRSLRRTGCFL